MVWLVVVAWLVLQWFGLDYKFGKWKQNFGIVLLKGTTLK